MRDSSRRGRKWVAPLVCAAVVLVFLAALLMLPVLSLAEGGAAAEILVIALYAVPILAVIAGVVIVLIQRLREIRGGEEEDAKKY